MKLTSEDLNKIDRQVYENTNGLAYLADKENIYHALQQNLSLEYDESNIFLYYIDSDNVKHTVSIVPRGVDLSTFVGCTAFAISNPPSVAYVGTPIALAQSKQPNDCNQTTAWKVSDIDVASISSAGVITPRKIGATTVLGQCASYTDSFLLTVKRTVDLTDKLLYAQNVVGDGNQESRYNITYEIQSGATWGRSALEDEDDDFNNNFYVDPGEKVTFTVGTGRTLIGLTFFNQETGLLTASARGKTFQGSTTVEYVGNVTGTYSWINTTDSRVYVCGMVDVKPENFASSNLSILWEAPTAAELAAAQSAGSEE